uniref:Uncharacterized protein n=1 Tax=Acrobeloides nanus TaxID=290746 RepID=A0A914DTF9_9BILA
MANNEICFIADVEPLGYHSYFLKIPQNSIAMFNKIEYDNKNDDNYISNGLIRLDFDSQGLLYKFHDLTTDETYSLTQELLYYRGRSMDKGANWGDQPSGAYILNPVQEMKINNKIDLKNIK